MTTWVISRLDLLGTMQHCNNATMHMCNNDQLLERIYIKESNFWDRLPVHLQINQLMPNCFPKWLSVYTYSRNVWAFSSFFILTKSTVVERNIIWGMRAQIVPTPQESPRRGHINTFISFQGILIISLYRKKKISQFSFLNCNVYFFLIIEKKNLPVYF